MVKEVRTSSGGRFTFNTEKNGYCYWGDYYKFRVISLSGKRTCAKVPYIKLPLCVPTKLTKDQIGFLIDDNCMVLDQYGNTISKINKEAYFKILKYTPLPPDKITGIF